MFGNNDCKNCVLLEKRYEQLVLDLEHAQKMLGLKARQILSLSTVNRELVCTLEEIAEDKDEGNAEGYYGTKAYDILKELKYIEQDEE